MRSVVRWLLITSGLAALLAVTRLVVFYFAGVIAFFATAFQAAVYELSKPERTDADDRGSEERALPRRLQAEIALRAPLPEDLVIDVTQPRVIEVEETFAPV